MGRLQSGSWLILLTMFTWHLCTVVRFLGSSCVSEVMGALVSKLSSRLTVSNMGEYSDAHNQDFINLSVCWVLCLLVDPGHD